MVVHLKFCSIRKMEYARRFEKYYYVINYYMFKTNKNSTIISLALILIIFPSALLNSATAEYHGSLAFSFA